MDEQSPFVDYRYLREGPWYETFDTLRRVVGAIGRKERWANVKIGYTSRPHIRAYNYKNLGWQKLFPVYRTTSLRFAHDMEENLIEYAWSESAAAFICHNSWGGRNGRVAVSDEYYVYLAVAKKWARIRGSEVVG